MVLEMFWGGAPAPKSSGRDQAIAAGAELDELGYREDFSDEDYEPTDYYNPQTGEQSRKRGRNNGNKPAKRRVPGGIAPIAKKLTTDYDSDDARIIELKQQMYTDEQVSNKLQEEGRIRYQAKTVGSRWTRLRKMLDKKEDEKLDDELTDWHIGEDDTLAACFNDIEKRYEEERAKLELKKWKDVSMHLANKLGKKKYTGKACRERFEGLNNGTALVPIELDKDQSGRRKMRDERIAAAKKAREDAILAARRLEEEKQERQETKRREAAEANQRRVMAGLKKKAEKEERERVREERRKNKEKAREARLRILAQLRLERDWEMAKNRAEKKLYRQLTGGKSSGKPGRKKTKKNGYESEDNESIINEFESDEEEAEMMLEDEEDTSDDESDETETSDIDEPMVDITPALRRVSLPRKSSTQAGKAAPAKTALSQVQVTKETLLNPRSVLDDEELNVLLHFRDLPRRRDDETHAEVVARLAAADQELKSDQLDDLLAHASEKTKGKKVDKILRLQEADAKKSHMAELGLSSTDVEFMETYQAYESDEFRPVLEKARRERRDSVMQ